jgi:hypothetical protein
LDLPPEIPHELQTLAVSLESLGLRGVAFKIPHELQTLAVSLESLGLRGVAFSHEDTKSVLAALEHTTIAVCGGEAFVSEHWGLVPLLESWTCDRFRGETVLDFALRSRERALDFIDTCAPERRDHLFFGLEFSSQDDAA